MISKSEKRFLYLFYGIRTEKLLKSPQLLFN